MPSFRLRDTRSLCRNSRLMWRIHINLDTVGEACDLGFCQEVDTLRHLVEKDAFDVLADFHTLFDDLYPVRAHRWGQLGGR